MGWVIFTKEPRGEFCQIKRSDPMGGHVKLKDLTPGGGESQVPPGKTNSLISRLFLSLKSKIQFSPTTSDS